MSSSSGLETSCDETAAAVVTRSGEILSSVVASQDELHTRYGGVVPEIASRRHLELVSPVTTQALENAGASLDDLAGLRSPRARGSSGALLVGVSFAKTLAWAARDPSRACRSPARARRVALPPTDGAQPAVHVPPRERRPHAAPRREGARVVRGDRLDARRCRGRGVRQGRTAPRARLSRRARARPSRGRR